MSSQTFQVIRIQSVGDRYEITYGNGEQGTFVVSGGMIICGSVNLEPTDGQSCITVQDEHSAVLQIAPDLVAEMNAYAWEHGTCQGM